MMDIPTLDDVIAAAASQSGDIPEIGEVWQQVDGRRVVVVDISTNSIGPLEVRYLDGKHAGHRTRDGRFVVFGVRGGDPNDLIERVLAAPVAENEGGV